MPRSYIPAAALALLLACPAQAQTAPQPAAGDTLLTVSAEGRVSHAPDIATISAGVSTVAITARAAMAENASAMTHTIAALKAAGVAEKDIQTSSLNLSPQYAPQNQDNSPQRITGYRAANTVSVRLRQVAHVGDVIDALVAAGANEINGPDFGVADPDPLTDAARSDAVAKARARAELYAKAAGLHVARILSISEDGGDGGRPVPMLAMARMVAPTPVAAGEVDLTAHVTVAFDLAP